MSASGGHIVDARQLLTETQTTIRYTHYRSQVPRRCHPSPPQDLPSPPCNHNVSTLDTRQPDYTLETSVKSRHWHAYSLRPSAPRRINIPPFSMVTITSPPNRPERSRKPYNHRLNRNLRLQTPPLPYRHPATPALLLRNRRYVRRAHNPPPHRSRTRCLLT